MWPLRPAAVRSEVRARRAKLDALAEKIRAASWAALQDRPVAWNRRLPTASLASIARRADKPPGQF